MNEHVASGAAYEHWPLNDDGSRILEPDGSPKTLSLKFSPVPLSGLKELEDHLRREVLEAIQPSVLQLHSSLQGYAIAAAVDAGDRRRIGTAEFDRAVKTLSGMSYLAYLSLRRSQPEMSPRLALKVISDAAAQGRMELLQRSLFAATGFSDDEGRAGKDGAGTTGTPASQSTSAPPIAP